MSLHCAVFIWWSGCTDGGITAGSLAEWATFLVAAAALAAAVWAGFHTASAARSAREQATAAQAALTADAKVREEAQARLVYATQRVGSWLTKGFAIDKDEEMLVYDRAILTPPSAYEVSIAGKLRSPAIQLVVTVHNPSAEIINTVTIQGEDTLTGVKSVQVVYPDAIPPSGTCTRTLLITAPDDTDPSKSFPEDIAAGWVVTVQFRDSAGVSWSRTGAEPIQKLDHIPGSLPEI